jgi:hypothetical protein
MRTRRNVVGVIGGKGYGDLEAGLVQGKGDTVLQGMQAARVLFA